MTSDKQAVPGEVEVERPASRNGQDSAPASREVDKLYKADTSLVIWLVFLALGGGLLALYYARIGYLPDIEWSSSVIYLAVASFIGGGVGLLLAMSVLLPGVIWSEFLLSDCKLRGSFCYPEVGDELCVKSILKYLGLPFGIVLLIWHFSLKAYVLVRSPSMEVILYVVICSILLVTTWLVMRRIFIRLLESADPTVRRRQGDLLRQTAIPEQSGEHPGAEAIAGDAAARRTSPRPLCPGRAQECPEEGHPGSILPAIDEKHKRIFKYASWFTLSVLLNQISMLVIYRLSGRPEAIYFFVLTVICATGVLISNHVVAIRYRQHPRQAVVASLVAAALLLFAADRLSSSAGTPSLSEVVMSHYGFGSSQTFALVVNDEGAAIIKKLKLTNITLDEEDRKSVV